MAVKQTCRSGVSMAIALAAIILGALFAINSGIIPADGRPSPEKRMKFIEFDVNDPQAMAKWARGVCRGKELKVLADYFDVQSTPEAVADAIASDLPGHAKKIVIEVCESELRSKGR